MAILISCGSKANKTEINNVEQQAEDKERVSDKNDDNNGDEEEIIVENF